MARTYSCTICEREDRAQIDAALREGTSDRMLTKRFAVGRTALRNHRTDHVTGVRHARPNAKGGRPPNPPAVPQVDAIELGDPMIVMNEYAKLYAETRLLLEQAKTGGDLVRIEKAIAACADVLDRFAKQLGLFTDGGTVVNVDARQVTFDQRIPDDVLRAIIDGRLDAGILQLVDGRVQAALPADTSDPIIDVELEGLSE